MSVRPKARAAALAVAATAGLASASAAAEYRIVSIDGAAAPDESRLTFAADGGIGAYAGCNRIAASGRMEEGRLVLDGPAAMTRMMCPPDLVSLDDALGLLLDGEVEIRADPFEGTLTLLSNGIEAVLVPATP
jgi:heat shock protein HslJ